MAESHLASPIGAATVFDAPVSLEQRKQQLVETLRKKVEQGYVIESQTDTEAVLVTKGHRRWFGLVEGGPGSRQTTSIDQRGCASTRSL